MIAPAVCVLAGISMLGWGAKTLRDRHARIVDRATAPDMVVLGLIMLALGSWLAASR